MATWSLRQLQQSLLKRKPSSLYLIFGEEDYLIKEALALIESKVNSPEWKDFNIQHFEGAQVSGSHLKDVVMTWPIMSSQKLVICRNAEKIKKLDWEILTPLIESPVESCILVFVAQKVEKQKKYFRQLCRHGTCVELKTPYDDQVAAWIQYIARSEGLQMDPEAVHLMHQLVGNRLAEIKNEILKIKASVQESSVIQATDVLQIASKSRTHNIFELTDAIGRKDITEALIHLSRLLEKNTNEMAILSLILRHFRILRLVHEGQFEKLSGQKLSAFVGVPFFFLKQYQQQAQLWDSHQIRGTIQLLHQMDKELKSSPLSSRICLENLIIKSCQPM